MTPQHQVWSGWPGRWATVLLAASSLLTGACQHAPDTYRAAYVDILTPAQLQEVRETLATAVDQAKVNVRSDAFAATHILVLEPRVAQTPLGTVATGTTTTRPPTFHLLSDGNRCLLEDQTTGTRYPLAFSCQPIAETDNSAHNN